MGDSRTAPLTDGERAELEELRAEKARREEEERARRERAELEALRAERAAARPATGTAPRPEAAARPAPAEKTFGQRMVTMGTTDDDGIPAMPPAQKIIIGLCLALVVAFAVWGATR